MLASTGKVDKDPQFLGKSIGDLALYVNGKAASSYGVVVSFRSCYSGGS